MKKEGKNYAFIDGQNIYLGVHDLGWKLHWKRFRVLLAEHYGVEKAFLFVGFVAANQSLYTSLQDAGFVLIFKPIAWDATAGKPKGNVDADLVLHTMLEYANYEKAIIASSDGDFWSLVDHLRMNGKLEAVLSPKREKCSQLLMRAAQGRIAFLDQYRNRIEYRSK